jgi:hypothetical protein
MDIEIQKDKLIGRPLIEASQDPCYEVNPILWRLFCVFTRRPIESYSEWWTEQDVVSYFTIAGLKNR